MTESYLSCADANLRRPPPPLPLTDSQQELKAKIDNHEADVEKMRGERESTKNKLTDEQDALAVYERKRSAAQTSHGRLLALKQVRALHRSLTRS